MKRILLFLLLIGAAMGQGAENAAPLVVPSEARDDFHFAVLGDSQFHDPAGYNRLINDLVWLQPAFVVQVGDMITGYAAADQLTGQWQRFKAQIAPLAAANIAFMPVPGNHDVYGPDKNPDQAVTALYRRVWGPTYYDFSYGNSVFIVLNSDEPGSAGRISDAQLQWLEQRLKRHKQRQHRFVFLHRPPDLLPNAERLHEVFERYGVHTVFYGHHHHYHRKERDGVQYIMTNAAANSGTNLDASGSFDHLLQVSVRDQTATVAVIRADSIEPPDAVAAIDNYDLFALNRTLLSAELSAQPLAGANVAGNSHPLSLSLHNSSKRKVTIYLHCTSEDERWRFEPQQLAPLTLAPSERRKLAMIATSQTQGPFETLPHCIAAFPFQSASGHWHQQSVEQAATVTAAQSAAQ